MSKIANRLPDQPCIPVQVCPETRMVHGNQLDAVSGGYGCLPAAPTVREAARISDGTSNTILFAE
jgi:hypothetical protein